MKNLVYSTPNIPRYFGSHRVHWDEFYPSERKVIEALSPMPGMKILDMGCACGGLGNALREKFGITDYTGNDINEPAIREAKKLFPWAAFWAGDFLDIHQKLPRDFDLAFSLSCADWNVETEALYGAVFGHVKNAGHLVISCRVTDKSNDGRCFEGKQEIRYPNSMPAADPEYAPYKVYPVNTMMRMVTGLQGASEVYGYGYWGKIPDNVIDVSLERVFFLVLSVRKKIQNENSPLKIILDVPEDLRGVLVC